MTRIIVHVVSKINYAKHMIAKCLDPIDTGDKCKGRSGDRDLDGKFPIILSSHDEVLLESLELER